MKHKERVWARQFVNDETYLFSHYFSPLFLTVDLVIYELPMGTERKCYFKFEHLRFLIIRNRKKRGTDLIITVNGVEMQHDCVVYFT